jgi:hypothetical protein
MNAILTGAHWAVTAAAYSFFMAKALGGPWKSYMPLAIILQVCMSILMYQPLSSGALAVRQPWWSYFQFFYGWAVVATIMIGFLLSLGEKVESLKVDLSKEDTGWIWLVIGNFVIATVDSLLCWLVLPLLRTG